MNTLSTVGALLLCTLFVRFIRRRSLRLPLPPSPPAETMIGHVRLLPDAQVMAEAFHEWSQKYGMDAEWLLPWYAFTHSDAWS